MKPIYLLTTAAIFCLAACDGEKAQEAKQKAAEAGTAIGEAAKATGEAAKEIGGKGLEKAKDIGAKGLEKGREIAGAAGEKAKEISGLIAEKSAPAVESFKAKIAGFSEWSKISREKMGDDFAKVKAYMAEMNTRLGGISPDSLPEDLKTALSAYQTEMRNFHQLFRSSPTDEAGIKKWSDDNADALHQIEKRMMDAAKKLKEVAAQHGITGLDLGIPTEEEPPQ
jgi:hypothetical protein